MPNTSRVRSSRLANPKALLLGLRGRPDSEHEMSFNRLVIVIVMLTCILAVNPAQSAVPLLVFYWLASVAVFVQILLDNEVRVWRRLTVMVMDMAVISYSMHGNGTYAAGFWPLYLWVILGNGFRFGNPYLFATMAVAIICFGLVIATTPFWHNAMELSVGLMVGLVIVPTYASQLIRKLSNAKRKAEEANRAKSYFLASVSHELRTPLTAIIGLSAHLQDSDLPLDQRTMAGTIATAGRSLLSLINQLLDFARLGAKGIAVDPKPFGLIDMLVSVRELMKVGAGDKGLRIALHVTPRTPLAIKGDESHIRDILVNLVGNAVKFTEAGTITISADAEPMPAGGYKLRLSVTDTGIGIEEEAQQHIFDSFRQADNSILDRFGGTGLGLAICKQVVELLGGEIGVESKVGEGSRFWFTAKVEAVSESERAPQPGSRQFILLSSDTDLIAALRPRLEGLHIALLAESSIGAVRALAHDVPAGGASAVLIDEQLLRRSIKIEDLRQMLGHEIVPVLLRSSAMQDEDTDPLLERIFISVVTTASSDDELAGALGIGAASGPQAAFRNPPEEIAPPDRPLHILVADDNAMNQKVFAMILGRAGHRVTVAGDGEAALDIMRDHAVDIVLMDVNMPVLNGIEATKLYRFTALGRKRVPIVGITADASPETSDRCIEAGMDACIAKPVEAAPLLELIGQLTDGGDAPVIPAFDPSGVVTPLFRTETPSTPAINWDKLRDLEELGGQDFVADLLGQYVADAHDLIEAVATAVETGNLQGFRDGTHALRSSGANIGADRVAELCLHFQRIEHGEFTAKGAEHLDSLRTELDRVRDALAKRRQEPPLAVNR